MIGKRVWLCRVILLLGIRNVLEACRGLLESGVWRVMKLGSPLGEDKISLRLVAALAFGVLVLDGVLGVEGSDLRQCGGGFGHGSRRGCLDLCVAEPNSKFARGWGGGRVEESKESPRESGAAFESDSENICLDVALGGHAVRIAGVGCDFVPRILDFSDTA